MKYYKNGTQITVEQIEVDGIHYEIEEDSNIAGLVAGKIYDDTTSEYPYLKFVEQCNQLYKFRVVDIDDNGNAIDTDTTIELTYNESKKLVNENK